MRCRNKYLGRLQCVPKVRESLHTETGEVVFVGNDSEKTQINYKHYIALINLTKKGKDSSFRLGENVYQQVLYTP